MSLFGSGHSTVGAGKSGAESTKRFGPDAPWFFPVIALLLFFISPVAAIVAIIGEFVSQARRVRWSRITLFAAVTTLLGVIVAGFNPVRALLWHANGTISLWTPVKVFDLIQEGVDTVTNILALPGYQMPVGEYGILSALAHTMPIAIPTGAWLAAFYAFWMAYRRAPMANLEGAEYDWSRPDGILDHRRAASSREKILSGAAIDAKRRTVGIGVGRYGALVNICVDYLQRPTLIFGGPRQGKTMFGLGLISQAAVHGSGWLIVDFKGDAEVPAYAAAWAAAHGRKFKHFQLADKNGAPYRRPHAQAPATPACYDPLRRGNATSKTDMLVNSVGREGDAAAYFRRAYELTQVIYQVASLTGYDRDKGGFQVLEDLLDLDHLIKVADTIGPDGRGALADHPKLRARVESMVNTVKRDDILRGAIGDMSTTLSTYGNGPAAGPWLRPGSPEETINIYDAVKNGEVVVFSLSEQDYGDLAKNIGTLVLLDLQNVIAELRVDLGNHREHVGDDKAPPPWPPFYVEVEEFGAAGADAVLGVLNRSGDVQVRPFLSTQSYHDVVAVDGTGVFADRVIDQAGNIFCFSINSGKAAEVLSELTPEVTKCYPRDRKEFSGGLAGMGLKAANIGSMEVTREVERQVPPGAFQELERYHCLWIAKSPSLRVTHTYKAVANHWYEVIASVAVPPDVLGDVEVSDWSPPISSDSAVEQPVAAYGYYADQTGTSSATSPQPPWASGATPTEAQAGAQKPSFGPPEDAEQAPMTPTPPPAPTPLHATSTPVAPTTSTPQERPASRLPKFAWQQANPPASTPATASDEPPLPEPDLDMGDTERVEGRETGEQPTSVGLGNAGKNPPAAQPAASEHEERQQETESPRGFNLDGFDEFN